jgi:hypothetical protein
LAAATSRRAAIAVVIAAGVAALAATSAGGQVTIPTLPGLTTTTVAPEPEPTPTTEPEPTTTLPVETTDTPAPPPELFLVPLTSDTAPVGPAPASTPTTAVTGRVGGGSTTRAALVTAISPAAVTGSFGLGVAGILGFAFVLIVLATRVRQGGPRMSDSRRNRLYLGVALLALAAVVGLVGYLKLSLEPDVNRQIPYLASAGMALVLLSAAGGALIVGEQLRADEERIEELEAAVLALSSAVSPAIEAPARRAPPRTAKKTAAAKKS